MQLEAVVQTELNTMVENGTIEKIIREKLTKTLNDVIEESLRSWSDFGKKLKEAVNKALDIDLERLSVLDYNEIVVRTVKEQLDASLFKHVQGPIADQIRSYVGLLEKQEWKLSEIIHKFISEEILEGKDGYEDGEIYCEVKKSEYGTVTIIFDETEKSWYDCKYRLYADSKDGKVFSFAIGDKYSRKEIRGDVRIDGVLHGFDGFIFKLYATGAKIILDEPETFWSTGD
ncbi:hypothetical protein [Flavihumibacter petaseus]|uniref:Uncharacterized protein n=1 Tax=Flavihumibacter petaseus NBRC 106054 TaxID=1220578 RepID=A0A0E9N171_9BACT|nr:hypothetical protein [Flavihumibacter petaseus]GAO43777.1 hypothetical protein FPE01S_02_08830 [Flavihumibacter petaseus NBRC 106054]